MIRTGTVYEVGEGTVSIRFMRPEACAKCGMCEEGHREKCHEITIKGQASVGDEVDVELEDKRLSLASLWAYVFPLVLMMAGLLLSAPIYRALALSMNTDAFAALCAFVGLGIALALLHFMNPMFKKNQWQPHIVHVHKHLENQP